jgi:hypothetical protein
MLDDERRISTPGARMCRKVGVTIRAARRPELSIGAGRPACPGQERGTYTPSGVAC